MTLKILRPGIQYGSVPHPGLNKARMHYYRNPLTDLYGASGSNLIGVWTIDGETDEFVVRLVRTTKAWGHLGPEQVDIDFILPDSGAALDRLEFTPSDEEMTLPFDFEDDDEEEGGHVGPTGG
jgi:hypothetical protein